MSFKVRASVTEGLSASNDVPNRIQTLHLFYFHSINKAFIMSVNDQDPVSENPYAAPKADLSNTDSAQNLTTEQRDLRAFVGAKGDYYLAKWNLNADSSGAKSGFNWGALLLAGLWLGYRKMYRITVILYLIILVETIAEEVIIVGVLGEPEQAAGLGRLLGIVVAIVCGSQGNRWYLSHARKVISEVRALGLDDEAVSVMLKKRGGTNLFASLGLLLLFIVANVVVAIVLQVLLYPGESLVP